MSEDLWRAAELEAVFGPPSAPLSGDVTGVSIDTRTLRPGELFIAIKGDQHDGHDHVEAAFNAGACAALVSRARAEEAASFGPVFAVEDTLKAMERLGEAARARSGARIVAVTGSVGKTSAKEMLRLMLAMSGKTHASAASFNNHWGVPLTLARLPRDADFAVIEIGMNHAGEITPLVGLARPHVAFVTTIAPVHIEYFGSLEAIADAKAEIFSGVEPGGVAILNRDAPEFERLAAAAKARGLAVKSFAVVAPADTKLLARAPRRDGSIFDVEFGGGHYKVSLGAPGQHMVENALGALLVVDALGADVEAAARALADFRAQKGRGERFQLKVNDGAFTVIDESYNANPASMRAALRLLGGAILGEGGRRIAVIGDMLELGEDGPRLHAELIDELTAAGVDQLFAAGPLSKALYDAAAPEIRGHWAARAEDLHQPLFAALQRGDVAMIKGSNGSRMGPLVAALKDHFARL